MDLEKDKSDTAGLQSAAVDSVTGAISRGRKRRSTTQDVADGEIRIGPVTAASTVERLADPAKQLQTVSYHKRRKANQLPGQEVESDDESLDEWAEWEEEVGLDADAIIAGGALLEQDAEAKRKAQTDENANSTAKPPSTVPDNDSDKSAIAVEAERKARARLRAAAKRKRVIRQHSLHILLSIATSLRLDEAAGNDNVGGFALSIAPEQSFLRQGHFREDLAHLGLWLRMAFRLTVTIQHLTKKESIGFPKQLCSAAERAIICAQVGSGDIMDATVVVAALVRRQGHRCRIVTPLQPVSHKAPRMTRTTHKVTGKAKLIEANPASEAEAVLYTWIEIWCPDTKRWTPVDVCEGFALGEDPVDIIRTSISRIRSSKNTDVSSKTEKEKPRLRNRRSSRRLGARSKDPEEAPPRTLHPALFTHVVAVEEGVVTDVTRRYTRNWNDVEKARARGRVFERILERFQSERPADTNDEAHRLEVDEFDALAADEAMPTSISAFQKHPRYMLERFLKRYEVIHPRKPIMGYFKDEPVFLRSRVHLLHTKDRWTRQMREVMDGAKPLKIVKSMNGSADTVDLFGEWQTVPLLIPECVDGKVPRSIHGNVDLWTPKHLPKGTVHINMSYARMAARKLGVDFAPAMTGFEPRRGRPVPKIEGVVVAIENGDLIRDAARSEAQSARARQQKKEMEEARKREEQAAREAKAREKVRKKYGGLLEEEGTFEQRQKREGLRKARKEKYGGDDIEKNKDRSVDVRMMEKAGSSSGPHEHDFLKPKHVKDDTFRKKCKTCGLVLTYEEI